MGLWAWQIEIFERHKWFFKKDILFYLLIKFLLY